MKQNSQRGGEIDDFRKHFGRQLKEFRRATGLTQDDLAKQMRPQSSNRTISDLERGVGTKAPARALIAAYIDGCFNASAEDASVKIARRDDLYSTYETLVRLLERREDRRRSDEGMEPSASDSVASDQHWTAAKRFPNDGQWHDPVALRHALPPDLAGFTGRQHELLMLRSHLHRRNRGVSEPMPEAVVFHVISGLGGVGKTALAVHAAHGLLDQYPDLQLYVDLRGFDGSGRPPLDPGTVLADFLVLLGVPRSQIPSSIELRVALYRDRLADKRALVLLDNAAHEGQVRPLLPAGQHCLVLVTSRERLLALDGAKHLDLDVFTPAEALELLTEVIGRGRVDAEPAASMELCRLCGHLGIALAVTAKRVQSRPTWTISSYVTRLSESKDRVQELGLGDRSVAAVFDLSYRPLPERHRQVFLYFSLHPGDDATAFSTAALAGIQPEEAEAVLEDLLDMSLLGQKTIGRYRMHDLVRMYAFNRVKSEETEEARYFAIRNVVAWYLHTAYAASRVLNPGRRTAVPELADSLLSPLLFDSYQQAMSWCEAERTTLAGAVRVAADNGLQVFAWQLAVTLWDFYYLRNYWDDWKSASRLAIDAARSLGDDGGLAAVLTSLGVAYRQTNKLEDAVSSFLEAIELRRKIGDRYGEGATLSNLGVAYRYLGRFNEAVACYHKALDLNRAAGDRRGEGITWNNLGEAYRHSGRHAHAIECYEEALQPYRDVGDRRGEAIVLMNLGVSHLTLGDTAQAIAFLLRSESARRQVGDRRGLALTLDALGQALNKVGDRDNARHRLEEALELYDTLADDQRAEAVRGLLADIA